LTRSKALSEGYRVGGILRARWALIELYISFPVLEVRQKSDQVFKGIILSPVDGYMSTGRIDEYYKRYKAAELQYKKQLPWEFCSELSDVG
jgi:hypothetical protein